MEVQILSYGSLGNRLAAVRAKVEQLEAQGRTVLLVHRSEDTVRRIGPEFSQLMYSTYVLSFTKVLADCIILIDGDILDNRTVARLNELGKDVFVLIPDGVVADVAQCRTIAELRKQAVLVPPRMSYDDEYPRTFGCRHIAETCSGCEGLVTQWKADRREKAIAALN